MRVLGFDISRAKAPASPGNGRGNGGGQLTRPSAGQGPYTSLFEGFEARKVMPSLYEALRESIPVWDAAISRLISLDGIIRVEGENQGLIHEIEDWMEAVQVNDMQRGLQAFINNQSNEKYEQGFAISEPIYNNDRSDIIRINVADSKDIRFRRTAKGIEIWYRGWTANKRTRDAVDQVGDILQGTTSITSDQLGLLTNDGWKQLRLDSVIYDSMGNDNMNPYGVSIMRSTEFVSKILLTIQNSTLNVWERFGDPIYQVTYKAGKGSVKGSDLLTRKTVIEDEFNKAISAKRAGKSADFVQVVDANSEIQIKVIGHDNQIIEIEQPSKHVLEQIVARTGLPSWMLGMHWSTTERLAKYEVEIILQEANVRAAAKLAGIYRVVNGMLKARGLTWKRGDFELYFEQPNLHDEVAKAQARFLNAQADYYDNQYGAGADKTNEPKGAKEIIHVRGGKACGCDNHARDKQTIADRWKSITQATHCKEVRPIPHPELEQVERNYETALVNRTDDLHYKVLTILKLQGIKAVKGPEDLPDALTFTFTNAQRQAVYKAMDDFIGEWHPVTDPEEVLKWYYGQSYSLGLIQAAQMLGSERPVLNIIKNSEIYADLVKEGFSLVKYGATREIKDKILSEIEAQMLAGTNPRHVADRLARIFGDANENWERLARSEMAMSAERAKGDEFKAEGETRMGFYAAADACPLCRSLDGDYDIDDCPLPVADTHPRCYCTRGPAREKE